VLGAGHGTEGYGTEAVDDAQDAVLWVRDHGADYRVNPNTGWGPWGSAPEGCRPPTWASRAPRAGTRVDAAVTWSGCMHLETPNRDRDEPHPLLMFNS
jgi:hypothetical protein